MIGSVIIEDNKRNTAFLTDLITEYCQDIKLLGEANSVKTAIELILRVRPALVFLDVEMPDGTAFDLLEQLPEKKFNIIFTTAHDHYAIKAIKFSALDYLLKPINFKDLVTAVEKAKAKMADPSTLDNINMLIKNLSSSFEASTGKIAFPTMNGHTFVDVNEIIRLEAEGNYTCVYLANKEKIVAARTLKEFEVFVERFDFVRIHRTHLINIHHVKKYVKGNGGYVVMDDGSTAEVSVRKKEEFLQKISLL